MALPHECSHPDASLGAPTHWGLSRLLLSQWITFHQRSVIAFARFNGLDPVTEIAVMIQDLVASADVRWCCMVWLSFADLSRTVDHTDS